MLGAGTVAEDDAAALDAAVDELLEQRLADVARTTPGVRRRAARLPARHASRRPRAPPTGWSPGSAASRTSPPPSGGPPGCSGDLDHFGALGFLQGLLTVLRDTGHPGLVLVLDEVETLQRVRSDARDKALNALRQLIDEVDAGRFPGLYLVITGTPAFFDGTAGRAAAAAAGPAAGHRLHHRRPLRQPARRPDPAARLHLDSPGRSSAARSATSTPAAPTTRRGSRRSSTTPTSPSWPQAVDRRLGGKVGVAPRLFLKKLVGDVLDRVDQFPDFDPRRDYALTARRRRADRGRTQRRVGRRRRPRRHRPDRP